jgi:hypothetical protein
MMSSIVFNVMSRDLLNGHNGLEWTVAFEAKESNKAVLAPYPLGHASLKITMIYTHCVPVRTVKEAAEAAGF